LRLYPKMTSRVELSPLYTPEEIARAAGVVPAAVRSAIGTGTRRWDALVGEAEAVRLVVELTAGRRPDPMRDGRSDPPPPVGDSASARAARLLFSDAAHTLRAPVVPAAASGVIHGLILSVALVVTGAGFDVTAVTATSGQVEPLRIVYLVQLGPGGGGGGGGLRSTRPAPRAERMGPARVSSPIQTPTVVVSAPATPPEPKVLPSEPLPPIIVPAVSLPGDQQDRLGVLGAERADADSHGSGSGGGAGSGNGTGVGEGDGQGLGAGSGGGTGGGPYRPGSGVEPPVILREVRPTYTEEARARAVTGEVVLEVLVRRDGTVGSTRVITGLGSGLDERATAAVLQWRFAPARRLGTPVDVMVEIVVEFRMR
jgi:periplasmic protein TonB